jgi:Ni,Fe-hydrogenase III large subunit
VAGFVAGNDLIFGWPQIGVVRRGWSRVDVNEVDRLLTELTADLSKKFEVYFHRR